MFNWQIQATLTSSGRPLGECRLEMDMAKKPYEDTRVAKYLEQRVLKLRPRKTQPNIAEGAGFVNANMIAMLKSGSSKVPLDRVPHLPWPRTAIPPGSCSLLWNRPKGTLQ